MKYFRAGLGQCRSVSGFPFLAGTKVTVISLGVPFGGCSDGLDTYRTRLSGSDCSRPVCEREEYSARPRDLPAYSLSSDHANDTCTKRLAVPP